MPLPRSSVRLLGAFTLLALLAQGSKPTNNEAQVPLGSDDFVCEHPPYKVHLVSKSPLVVYISDFLTPEERAHLRDATRDSFAHSAVTDKSGGQTIHRVRTSQSTNVPRDAVVRCMEDRALDFQGFDVPRSHLEPVQLVKYGAGERYHFHTDWFTDVEAHATAALGGNRLSSFFAYVHVSNGTDKTDNTHAEKEKGAGAEGKALDARVRGGGTNFPLLEAPTDERWCSYIDCDEPWDNGVTFRPVEGNAVYWENLLPNGLGDHRTLHAGLPVVSGEKIGMNIWTRQAPLGEDIRGPDV